MKGSQRTKWRDLLVVAIGVVAIFGCMASSYRTARTLEPGQSSLGAGYMAALDAEGDGSDRSTGHFASLDARVGVARGLDLGVMHSWDMTDDTDGELSTLWFDMKGQLSNRDNQPGRPIVSLGLVKGYVYSEDIEQHLTGIPLMIASMPSERTTINGGYRIDFFSDGFFPADADELENPRHLLHAGAEFALTDPRAGGWTPRLGLGLGYYFGDPWAKKLSLNFGFSIDSPLRDRSVSEASVPAQ